MKRPESQRSGPSVERVVSRGLGLQRRELLEMPDTVCSGLPMMSRKDLGCNCHTTDANPPTISVFGGSRIAPAPDTAIRAWWLALRLVDAEAPALRS